MLKKNKREKFVCPACGCMEYDIKNYGAKATDDDTGKLIGKYAYYVPVCRKCGQSGFLDYIEKENRRIEAEVFRKYYDDILKPEQIKSLPKRYNISRADFLKVMHISNVHDIDGNDNWEVFDIWSGDLPSGDEEERLQKVYKSPKAWMELLEANKDLVTKEVYERSMNRAKNLSER